MSGLGGRLAVGITAVAIWKQIKLTKLTKLEIFMEDDIWNPAVWGAGGSEKESAQMGFQDIRVKVSIEPRTYGDSLPKHPEQSPRRQLPCSSALNLLASAC